MMNVAYVYAPYELTAPSLSRIDTIILTPSPSARATLYLYHNDHVLPRVYFAEGEVFATSERDAFLKMMQIPDFGKETVIECTDCTARATGLGTHEVVSYENGHIVIDTDTEEAVWLVVSESMLPGWKAYVDGTEVPVYYANYLFQTVEVPAGKHRVTFEYRDRFSIIDLLKAL